MNMINTFIISIAISSSFLFPQNSFSITKILPPIEIDYITLNRIIDEGLYLISKYDSSYYLGDIAVTISNNNNEEQSIDNFSNFDKVEFEKATGFSFEYSNYYGNISRLKLSFRDYQRTIELCGSNYIELQTISNMLYNGFIKERKYFSGSNFRNWGGILLFIIAMIFLFNPQIITDENGNSKLIFGRNYFIIIFGFLLNILFLLFFTGFLKGELLFPGFTLIKNNVGFLKQNSSLFTFLSFLLAIIGLPIIQKLLISKRSETKK